ncbi:MAG TPA: pitrilysin family protein [Pirellulales bacterium]|nr:pitrilysin family protein [Pirellulales bacterium]
MDWFVARRRATGLAIFCTASFYALVAAVWLGPVGMAPISAATKVTTIEGFSEYRLDNGLQVILCPDDSKPTVTVNLTIFVGSRHEGYGETGMAHLLEHMLFKGTPTYTQIPKALQERGAKFNGTTWVDRTNYYETLPATDENLDFALSLEADRMINSNVSHEDLISEMTVVRNEFERGENSPGTLLYQRLLAVAYEWHNYGKVTIGNRSDIERVPIERLKQFYVKFYQPDNAMLVVAGQFDEAKALEMIEKTFGAIPKPKRKLDHTYTEEPPQDGERTVMLRRVGDVGLVGALYHIPAGPHPDMAAFDILTEVLGNAPSGRLYKSMVETKKATSIRVDASSWHDPGVFELIAEVRRGDSLEDAQQAMFEGAETVAKQPVDLEEVDRARRKILTERELIAADTAKLAVQLSNWASQGDWRLYFLYRDRIEKVTPEDVTRVASTFLIRSNRTSGIFIPTPKPDRITIPPTPPESELFADFHPREGTTKGESFDPTPENIDAHTQPIALGKGIKGLLLPKKTRGQTVHLHLDLRYGTKESLKRYRVATELLPELMTRGTKELTRAELQDRLDKNMATLHAAGEKGVVTFTLETKRANLPVVLDLLRQVLREPTLPEKEWGEMQRESLANLDEQLTDPQSLALVRLRRTVNPYSKDDIRYIPTPQEEIEEVSVLKAADFQKLYGDFLGAQAGELAMIGDFDPEEVRPLLEKVFENWKTKQPYQRIEQVVFDKVPGGRQQILTPDKANAIYVAGETFALSDSDPDFAPLVLGNFIFGGGALSSRLGDRVRQKEGLSYGVGANFHANSVDRRSVMMMYAIYNPTNLEKIETAMSEELSRLLADGVTAEELARGKTGYLQDQKVGRTSDGHLSAVLADNLYANRSMKFYAELEHRIAEQTPETVLAALKKYIDPKRLVIVTAGDFKNDKQSADKRSADK